MNIIFFGSDNFSVPCLEALIASGHKVDCVVTQPDKRKGRGLSLSFTPVKDAAGKKNLRLYQPDKINTPEVEEYLKAINADLFVVVAYGQILSRGLLDIPKKFALNVHASLLPAYRGAAPINWTIIKGEKTTGITLIKMSREMDAGPMLMQKAIAVSNDDTAVSLEAKLSASAAGLLPEALRAIESDNFKLIAQDKNRISFAPKLKKQDGMIDWNKPAEDIYNLIRGSIPWPGAFAYYQGKLLKIYRAQSVKVSECQSVRGPGEVIDVSKNGIMVATGKDNLLIKELQMEGKRIMGAQDFIAGHKIKTGEILDKK